MHVLDGLRKEHDIIGRAFGSMEAQLRSIENAQGPVLEFLQRIVDFLDTYAARSYFAREDEIIHDPLLDRVTAPMDRKLITRQKADHHQQLEQIEKTIQAASLNEESDDHVAFAGTMLMNIISLAHKYKEYTERGREEVFPRARSHFKREDWERIRIQFNSIVAPDHFANLEKFCICLEENRLK
ncbi:MAG: hypothetical protein GF398_18940 [Chitinivibrionales bacterium]|nr:hypothetical protein [Chitinivibrionales bacterium]